MTSRTWYHYFALITLFLFDPPNPVSAQSFDEFLSSIARAPDSASATRLVNEYLSRHATPVVEDNQIHFLYRGNGEHVAVPSEINRWNPSGGVMKRVNGTDLFFRTEYLPANGRLEYKIWVDSAWMLDPMNQKTSPGGFGANSDVWMPRYRPSPVTVEDPHTPRGSVDTLWIESMYLHRKHPLFVYSPPSMNASVAHPFVIVTDGSDYLSFARMNRVLDNLIGNKKIAPLVGIFIDPKTELNVDSTNKRMTEYAASDEFLDFVEKEVIPQGRNRFPLSTERRDRLILGASMGGLISTYAALKRPDVFPNGAAQSPAYTQANKAVITLIDSLSRMNARIYIQTGTVNDTQEEAKLVATKLRQKGGVVRYEEFPEGHNWTNWKSHLPKILQYFFPR